MPGVRITCCACGERFDERALKGAWLDRRCPLCGAKLSEEAFDAQAREVLKRHRPQLGKRGTKALEQLAFARYYASEWFRLACAGQGSEAADKGLFGLKPGYRREDGAFDLVPADGDRSPEGGWGISAEYFVFDALRAEVLRPDSPLAGARIVPRLVFPWLPGQKPKQWGAKHRAEVDFVVLCQSCAVVVEVKRRSHHVRASRDFHSIRERTDDGQFRSASEVIEQVTRGADSFFERQSLYPRDRILRLIVFVEPLSFSCAGASFRDGLFASWLDAERNAHFLPALRRAVDGQAPLAGAKAVRRLADRMLAEFGNTAARREGRIVVGQGPALPKRKARTRAMLDALRRSTRAGASPLAGARVLTNLTCEVQMNRRQDGKFKQVELAGLLLTRTHAVLVEARLWPVHVNTHVPFATVYAGEPREGARAVEDSIRHDWDLEEIHYKNRSGSLTLLTYVAKSLPELDRYRERNRLCTLHVFVDPASFHSDCDDFRQKTFVGYWRGRANNVLGALERLTESAEPIMSQAELDVLADSLAALGEPAGA